MMTGAISLVDESKQQEARSAGLYAQAVRLVEAKEWQKALEKWAKVQAIDPTYPDPQNVVTRAKKGLAELEAAVSQVELVLPPVEEETVPIWRRVPVWVWVAIGGAILLAAVIAGATWLGSPGPESLAVVSPTSTPVPATATPTPTADVAATETALAEQVAGVVAASLAQTATAMPTSTPTPTDTPTQTPVPPTAMATRTLTSPTPTPVSAAIPQPTSSITLTIYLRETNTETGFVTLSSAEPYGSKIYQEGKTFYGDAAVPIGDTLYHFVGQDESGQLPDPWRVEFEFAEALVARTGNQAGFDPKKAWFWAGTLDENSAVGWDNPYDLTIKLYEEDDLRETLQVWFTVADAADFGEGLVFSAEEVGSGGGGGGGGPPIVPPGQGGEPPGQAKDKKEPPGKGKGKDK